MGAVTRLAERVDALEAKVAELERRLSDQAAVKKAAAPRPKG